MAENEETIESGGENEAPKPKRRRTRAPRQAPTSDTNAMLARILEQNERAFAEIAQLRAENEALKKGAIVDEIAQPPAAEALKPGEYYNVGTPDKPVVMKRHWTKADMEREYTMVEFRPEENMVVAPHGVTYELTKRVQVRVPSIVMEFHDEAIARRDLESKRYRPLSMMENYALAERAMMEPDVKHWSRLYRLPGSLHMPQAVETSPTADAAEEIAARANKK